jgi:hypothetical protein
MLKPPTGVAPPPGRMLNMIFGLQRWPIGVPATGVSSHLLLPPAAAPPLATGVEAEESQRLLLAATGVSSQRPAHR